jgi:CDP-diacylglycerol--serine O-phosphatidyltransferase
MKSTKVPLYKLFPSILTIVALCLGLTAIKCSINNDFKYAVTLVLIASVMDGLDGAMARLLKSTSNFGAQLDSLVDLVNFGVAPGIIIYQWYLKTLHGMGWLVTLIYISCTALRLARYNTDIISNIVPKKKYFLGISSPPGAILILTPLMITFELMPNFIFNKNLIIAYMLFIALMMVSRIPTLSSKAIKVDKKVVPMIMAIATIVIGCLLLLPWIVMPFLSIIYLISIPFSAIYYSNFKFYSFINDSNSNKSS